MPGKAENDNNKLSFIRLPERRGGIGIRRGRSRRSAKCGRQGYPVKRSRIEPYLKEARERSGTTSVTDVGIQIMYESRGATDEEIQLFCDLLDTASDIRVHDWQIDSIIQEEAGAYFAGSKPIDLVADIIENRVDNYRIEMQ